MDKATCESSIQHSFRKQIERVRRVRRTFLLVQSDKLNVNVGLAESANGSPIHVDQPNHLASVGKLFPQPVIAMLKDATIFSVSSWSEHPASRSTTLCMRSSSTHSV